MPKFSNGHNSGKIRWFFFLKFNQIIYSSSLISWPSFNPLAQIVLDLKFSVCVKECQDRLSTMHWLPKLHKRPYKARFIANSSSCTTTELSKLLTSCLTAIKNHVIRYCEKVYERSSKNFFWSIKNSGEVLNKLKSRGFHATSLSTYMYMYDFSTLYTTLPHNLIKED